jgi:hypothetical protein
MFPVKWIAPMLFAGLFAGIVISLEVGYRIGHRSSRRIPERGFEGVGAMEAGHRRRPRGSVPKREQTLVARAQSNERRRESARHRAQDITVMFDFNYPRYGFIRVDAADKVLLQVRESM